MFSRSELYTRQGLNQTATRSEARHLDRLCTLLLTSMRNYILANIFRKSLRDNRTGVLVWGAGTGLIMAVGAAQYSQVIGGVVPERARMAAEAAKAFQAF